MKIITKAVLDMNTMQWISVESYDYDGPVALCDRSAQAADKSNAANAGTLAGQQGDKAVGEQATLNPFYTNEMKAEHGFDPTQTNELLTAAEAGSGGADSALVGDAALQAARTRNPSGFTKSLDEVARDKMKADAGASEGIAAQDVLGAKQLNQQGAAGEAGLFGENSKDQLAAMGQQQQSQNAEVEAGKSGWLQNMTGVISSLGDAAKGVSGFKMPCWVAAATYGSWEHPQVDIVRQFLFNDWNKRSVIGNLVAKAYMRFGERVAEHVKRSPMLKALFRNMFDRIH